MKFITTILTAVVTAIFSSNISASEPIASHVILIGLDGWGSYSFDQADMPYVKIS